MWKKLSDETLFTALNLARYTEGLIIIVNARASASSIRSALAPLAMSVKRVVITDISCTYIDNALHMHYIRGLVLILEYLAHPIERNHHERRSDDIPG